MAMIHPIIPVTMMKSDHLGSRFDLQDSAATVSEPQGGATGASVEISDMKEVSIGELGKGS